MSPVAVHDRKGLGAPVARTGRGPRPIEKAAIYAYRAGAWLMGRLPVPVARGIVSVLLQVSFLLWPKKRRFVNARDDGRDQANDGAQHGGRGGVHREQR